MFDVLMFDVMITVWLVLALSVVVFVYSTVISYRCRAKLHAYDALLLHLNAWLSDHDRRITKKQDVNQNFAKRFDEVNRNHEILEDSVKLNGNLVSDLMQKVWEAEKTMEKHVAKINQNTGRIEDDINKLAIRGRA